jgi:two-component system NarL family sensor kinase
MSDPNKIIIFIATIIALIMLLACFIINLIYQYHKRQFGMQKGIQELNVLHQKKLLQSQLEMQEQTFQKISSEIHDNISRTLSLSKLQLNTLNYSNPAELADKINLSIQMIAKAIEDLNTISKSLNSDFILNFGLLKAVENQVNDILKTGLYTVNFEIRGSPVSLGYKEELILFRIIQESLNNILKHSRATLINLHLTFTSTGTEVSVQDNGIGFMLPEKEYLATTAGLNNMKKRAQMLNASLTIITEPDKGSIIRIAMPPITT